MQNVLDEATEKVSTFTITDVITQENECKWT